MSEELPKSMVSIVGIKPIFGDRLLLTLECGGSKVEVEVSSGEATEEDTRNVHIAHVKLGLFGEDHVCLICSAASGSGTKG